MLYQNAFSSLCYDAFMVSLALTTHKVGFAIKIINYLHKVITTFYFQPEFYFINAYDFGKRT